MKDIWLVVGVPGSGKSWVCEQLSDDFDYVAHDDHIGRPKGSYIESLMAAADCEGKPVLAEAPFSISEISEPLEEEGFTVHKVFIIENDRLLAERYFEREGKQIPRGHLMRQKTYELRAEEGGFFKGTSEEVLEYLKDKCEHQVKPRRKLV